MRNFLLCLFTLILSTLSIAQTNIFPDSGNVGVGTINPNTTFHIEKDNSGWLQEIAGTAANKDEFVGVKVLSGYAGETSKWVGISAIAESLYSNETGLGLYTGTNERVRVAHNGNVGIGLTVPNAPLHIRKNQSGWLQEIAGTAANKDEFVGIKVLSGYAGETSKWVGISAVAESLYSNETGLGLYTGTNERVRIAHNGNVGIGTITPDSKLTVKGKIHAEEVKVDLSVPAPDYVFKKDYDLLTIEEVQQHIKEHGHLPNVPSATEMETNGVELGVMNMKLLEKIEELTLYTITQETKLQEQRKINKTLEARLTKIETLLINKK